LEMASRFLASALVTAAQNSALRRSPGVISEGRR
jgi:hypothetical protein